MALRVMSSKLRTDAERELVAARIKVLRGETYVSRNLAGYNSFWLDLEEVLV